MKLFTYGISSSPEQDPRMPLDDDKNQTAPISHLMDIINDYGASEAVQDKIQRDLENAGYMQTLTLKLEKNQFKFKRII